MVYATHKPYLCPMRTPITVIGAGWLGLPLALQLQQDGHPVTATATTAEGAARLQAQGLSAIALRLGEGQAATLPPHEVVIVTIPPSGGAAVMQQAISEIATLAAQSRHILYISSTAVYPDSNREVQEQDAQHIASPHSGIDLLDLEERLQKAARCPVTTLRLGGLFGPGRHPGRFLAGKVDVPGPDSPVNMTHLADVIGAIQTSLQQAPPSQHRTYNVVAPLHPSRATFYNQACDRAGLPRPQWRPGPAPYKQVSSAKLMAELGYQFRHPDPMAALEKSE